MSPSIVQSLTCALAAFVSLGQAVQALGAYTPTVKYIPTSVTTLLLLQRPWNSFIGTILQGVCITPPLGFNSLILVKLTYTDATLGNTFGNYTAVEEDFPQIFAAMHPDSPCYPLRIMVISRMMSSYIG